MIDQQLFIRSVRSLMIMITLLIGVVSISPAWGNTSQIIEAESNFTAQSQELSTPELIEQAFAQAKITAEQRLLYLAYAIYDHSALPTRFHSNVGWFGTAYVKEIYTALDAAASGRAPAFSPAVQAELDRLLFPQAATVCDRQDNPHSTESANFYVNYAITGTHAITGGLTITDYTTSLETTFSTEVTSYGWAKPPLCTSGTGTCTNTNPWNKYPVQVVNLGSSLFGYEKPHQLAGIIAV